MHEASGSADGLKLSADIEGSDERNTRVFRNH
jgi:hypothetical protein